MKRVCVFCGSSMGARPVYAEAARGLGRAIAERGLGLVYGGAHVGLMGVVADAAMQAGGEVIGVIPEALVRKEIAHTGVQDLRIVASMHERKALMAELSDGFIALPGGIGTFEEFFEIITWGLLGLHQKPCALLNVDGYYDSLLALLDNAITEGFLKPKYRSLVLTQDDCERLLDVMTDFTPTILPKWINQEET